MDAARGCMVVHALLRGPQGKPLTRVFVAEVLGPYGMNPGLRIQHPLGVHAVAEICRLILSRQHLADPGLPPATKGGE